MRTWVKAIIHVLFILIASAAWTYARMQGIGGRLVAVLIYGLIGIGLPRLIIYSYNQTTEKTHNNPETRTDTQASTETITTKAPASSLNSKMETLCAKIWKDVISFQTQNNLANTLTSSIRLFAAFVAPAMEIIYQSEDRQTAFESSYIKTALQQFPLDEGDLHSEYRNFIFACYKEALHKYKSAKIQFRTQTDYKSFSKYAFSFAYPEATESYDALVEYDFVAQLVDIQMIAMKLFPRNTAAEPSKNPAGINTAQKAQKKENTSNMKERHFNWFIPLFVLALLAAVWFASAYYQQKAEWPKLLESSYHSGEESGYAAGYYVGKQEGSGEGYDTGYNAGYSRGYREGNNAGKSTAEEAENEGYLRGYDLGKYYGYQEGYEVGTTDGYETGYSEGYTEGYDDGYIYYYRQVNGDNFVLPPSLTNQN